MAVLYDPARHEALNAEPWSDAAALAHIERICGDLLARFDSQTLWPNHPLDMEEGEADLPRANLYFGAGGVIWALQQLRERGVITCPEHFENTLATLPSRGRVFTDAWGYGQQSWLMGETGLLFLQWRAAPSVEVAEALYVAVQANLHNPAWEFLIGSPGSMMAALFLAEATGEERWRALFVQAVQLVWDAMHLEDSLGLWLWTQDLYGKPSQYIGAGHGFVGNVFPVLRGAALLPAELVHGFIERTEALLERLALRDEAGRVNWHAWNTAAAPTVKLPLLQDCHGAPGILCRLRLLPPSPRLDSLLLAAGECVWAAGPLVKGPGLCHGTAGNGYALLTLYERSGNPLWLERARAFAMHAAAQSEAMAQRHGRQRYSLWNGDPGVALYLQACREGRAAFPSLDVL